MQHDGQPPMSGHAENFQTAWIVKWQAEFPFSADPYTVNLDGGLKKAGSTGMQGMWAVPNQKAIGMPVVRPDQIRKRDSRMGAVRSEMFGVQDAMVSG